MVSSLAVLLPLTGSPGNPSPAPPLAPGTAVERVLSSGEEHAYRVDAAAGRLLRVAAEQRGIDLEIRIEAPDGRELAWVDSPNGPRGPEALAVRPEVSGAHRVAVLARNRGTIAGSYRLEARELPEETGSERSRAAAELAASRAADLYRRGGTTARKEAAQETLQALDHWRGIGEEPGRALLLLGVLYRQLDEPSPALEALERARTRFAAANDAAGAAAAWNEIGYVHWRAGHPEPAREAYGRALTAWRALGDRHGEALALNNLGLVDHGQGELRQALERYEPAAGLFQSAGDFTQAALVENNLAGVWDLLGEPRRALEGYRTSLELLRQTEERSQEPRLLLNLAAAHRSLGEIQDALSGYRQALDLFRSREDRRGEAAALNNLGTAYRDLGEPLRARGLLEQALALRRETGDRHGEAASLQNLGLVRERLGESQEALDLLRKALVLREALGDRLGRAVTLEQMGSVHTTLGEPSEALRCFEAALALRAEDDPVGRGRALTSSAESWLSLGQPGRAAEVLRSALELQRAAGDRSGEARALVTLARVERAQGRPTEALAILDTAFARIEELRSRIASPELRASYLAARRGAYELAIDVRLDLHRQEPAAGHDRAALEVSERARARSLLDLLAASGGDVPRGTDPELSRRLQLLRERSGAKEKQRLALLAADAPAARRQEVERELESVLLEIQLLEGEIARSAAEPARVASFLEIQGELDSGTLLLEYALGEKRSILWAVSSSSLEAFELPGRAEIEALTTSVVRRWSTLDTRDAEAVEDPEAARLGRLLLGPVAGRLGAHLEIRRLAIVPDGALCYLPFAALPHPANGEPLLTRHDVVTLPSASFLAAQRKRLAARPPAAAALAVLADPVFDPRDPRVRGGSPAREAKGTETRSLKGGEEGLPLFDRLISSRREAETIASLAHAGGRTGEVLLALDFQARRGLLTDGRLAAFRILHFATHGTFHAEHPELSGIVLSLVDEAGRPQEGFLRPPDLRALALAADLVVLSGCHTALGREIRGEGLVGLSSSFLDAGARNVVASLWQVPDRATAELMGGLYKALLEQGAPPAAALRQAQLAVRSRRGWSDPYHWASFILLGEGR